MGTFEVRRPGTSDYFINDMGQVVEVGTTFNLLSTKDPIDIANSIDLDTALSSGSLIRVKGGIDQSYQVAYSDLILTQNANYISASWADSEADEAKSYADLADSESTRAESLARLNSPSEAQSTGNRAESLARLNSPSEARSIALLGKSYADLAESLARSIPIYQPGSTPPPNPTGGDIWTDGSFRQFTYDSNRGFWIETSRNWIRFSKGGVTGNEYLTTGGWVSADYYHIPEDSIIISIDITTRGGNDTKTFYFRNESTDLFNIPLPSSDNYYNSSENIEISAGTKLRAFVGSDGVKVDDPEVQIKYALKIAS